MANNSRRNFLGKLSMAALGAFGLSKTKAIASSFDEANNQNNNNMNTIFETQPMGFTWQCYDPFLFCAHHEDYYPEGNADMSPKASMDGRHLGDDFIIKEGFRMYHGKKVPGFPGHPHRGFETVTIVRKGLVDHSDSLGASGRYGEGDVQWMTAGGGVQHAEMFPAVHQDKPNTLELFQVWLNLPAKDKMVAPHFKMLWGSSIPKFEYKDAKGIASTVEVMAGTFDKHTAPAPPPNSWAFNKANEVMILNIMMANGAEITIPKASAGINRTIYFYEGDNININGIALGKYQQARVLADVDCVIKNGNTETSILVLQGKPIGEPVMQYGPFVMNSKEEINKAFEDYHKTQFGGWPWSRYDNVHDVNSPRFAKHADGTYEAGA
jgi:quercetin 2,3-dioxygenase